MQNTEPPKDAGEGEQKGNPSPSRDALLIYLRLGESPSLGCPSYPSLKPLPGAAEVASAAAISPAALALPRPPAWFFPAVEVGPGAGVERRVGARSRSWEGAWTRVALGVGFAGAGCGGEQWGPSGQVWSLEAGPGFLSILGREESRGGGVLAATPPTVPRPLCWRVPSVFLEMSGSSRDRGAGWPGTGESRVGDSCTALLPFSH